MCCQIHPHGRTHSTTTDVLQEAYAFLKPCALIQLTLIPTHPTLTLGLHRETRSHPFFLVMFVSPSAATSLSILTLIFKNCLHEAANVTFISFLLLLC